MTWDAKTRNALEKRLDELVDMAEESAKKRKDTEEAQFHNLENLAASTTSIRALENFIKYQMARKTSGKPVLDRDVGESILSSIAQLDKMAQQICAGQETRKRQVHMELIRLYLGFLTRAIVAQAKTEEQKRGSHA